MKRLRLSLCFLVASLCVAGPGAAQSSGATKSPQAPVTEVSRHLVSGIVHQVDGAKFNLETRTGKIVKVDAAPAVKAERSRALVEGTAMSAEGTFDRAGVLHADIIRRLKSARVMWPEDR